MSVTHPTGQKGYVSGHQVRSYFSMMMMVMMMDVTYQSEPRNSKHKQLLVVIWKESECILTKLGQLSDERHGWVIHKGISVSE